jgi:hypothetical protein|tara:strand:+ start:593 stop:961 length:369 start_codon:yes stop_codon:yes gene_type:complete
MTKLYEDQEIQDDPHPKRKGLRNFTWTDDSIRDWEEIWHRLWRLDYKWEWQNADRYARGYGDTYKLYACYNDAERLDMATPLPGIEVVEEVREQLIDDIDDASELDHLVGAIDRWLKKHYAP